jgi:hypothetical protein
LARIKSVPLWLLMAASGLGIVAQGPAGERYATSIYEGQIKSVRVDRCGLQPGLCEGSILLVRKGGGEAAVDIRVGTWIKRGDNFLTIENLRVGDHVKAQTFRMPGETLPRAAILEFTNP